MELLVPNPSSIRLNIVLSLPIITCYLLMIQDEIVADGRGQDMLRKVWEQWAARPTSLSSAVLPTTVF